MAHLLLDSFPVWDGKDSKEAHEIKQGLKSPEEIARYTLDESLGDLERAALFLSSSSAHPLQRLSVVNNLHQLLANYSLSAFDAVFPLLQVIISMCLCSRVPFVRFVAPLLSIDTHSLVFIAFG